MEAPILDISLRVFENEILRQLLVGHSNRIDGCDSIRHEHRVLRSFILSNGSLRKEEQTYEGEQNNHSFHNPVSL